VTAACGDEPVDDAPLLDARAEPAEMAQPRRERSFLPPRQRAELEELRGWSACLRRTAPRIHASFERFEAAVDPETGRRDRRSELAPFVHRVDGDLGSCRALPEPVSTDDSLCSAVDDYIGAVERYASVAATLAPYYDAAGYEDDGWTESRRLGPELSEAYDAFVAAAEALRPALRQARDEADTRALEALRQADAPPVAGLAIAIGRDARALGACFELARPDPDRCEAALSALETSYGRVVEIAEDPPQSPYVFWLQALRRTTGRLTERAGTAIEASRRRKRRRRSAGPGREEVLTAVRHVLDVADNVRVGL